MHSRFHGAHFRIFMITHLLINDVRNVTCVLQECKVNGPLFIPSQESNNSKLKLTKSSIVFRTHTKKKMNQKLHRSIRVLKFKRSCLFTFNKNLWS